MPFTRTTYRNLRRSYRAARRDVSDLRCDQPDGSTVLVRSWLRIALDTLTPRELAAVTSSKVRDPEAGLRRRALCKRLVIARAVAQSRVLAHRIAHERRVA